MWLIDCKTLEMRDIVNPEDNRYVILSHTWEDEEVDFQEMRFQRNIAMKKKGFNKINMTCDIAKERGIPYAWIDTCYIDKTSGAALSDTINSMFRWYKDSSICLAYLSDVSIYDLERYENGEMTAFPNSRWFTRGWTLQELIAPEIVYFYDMSWRFLGSKQTYIKKISDITGIDLKILERSEFLSTVPVGRRMSWASNRKTTRVEDMAYCLLGIFDINMPMIYGEGTKAFLRLQEEIAQNIDDLSLFAWTGQDLARNDRLPMYGIRGVLARSPAEFVSCKTLRNIRYTPITKEFSMTNRGLKIKTLLSRNSDKDYILGLNCTISSEDVNQHEFGICLTKTLTEYVRRDIYKTIMVNREIFKTESSSPYTIYIQKEVTYSRLLQLLNVGAYIYFDFSLPYKYEVQNVTAHPHEYWEPDKKFFF
ncbi:hypothetical protein F5884DRAFT_712496, partial [Xylogone sp. PMI_703]